MKRPARNSRAVRKAVHRPIRDATAGYARGQAGRAVESRSLLLATIVGCGERLECSGEGERVAGNRRRAKRVEEKQREQEVCGKAWKQRLESTVLVRRDLCLSPAEVGKRRLANGECDKVEGTWLVRKLRSWDRWPSTPTLLDKAHTCRRMREVRGRRTGERRSHPHTDCALEGCRPRPRQIRTHGRCSLGLSRLLN